MLYKYLNRTNKKLSHFWSESDEDTVCRMYSTGGIKSMKKYFISDKQEGRKICNQCKCVSDKREAIASGVYPFG